MTFHCIPPLDRRANKIIEQYDKSLPLSLYKIGVERLGTTPTNGGVCQ